MRTLLFYYFLLLSPFLPLNAPFSLPLLQSLSLAEAHTHSSLPNKTKHRKSTPFSEPHKVYQCHQQAISFFLCFNFFLSLVVLGLN
jgi:hypothetical protein